MCSSDLTFAGLFVGIEILAFANPASRGVFADITVEQAAMALTAVAVAVAGFLIKNFLDVGGGANQEQIENAFGILLSDPHVKAIFINIFGGILRVDVLATAVVAAARKLDVKLPIILRLEGTNVEEGRKILMESGLKFQVGATMKEAADLAVAAAKGGK